MEHPVYRRERPLLRLTYFDARRPAPRHSRAFVVIQPLRQTRTSTSTHTTLRHRTHMQYPYPCTAAFFYMRVYLAQRFKDPCSVLFAPKQLILKVTFSKPHSTIARLHVIRTPTHIYTCILCNAE